MKYRPEIDGLRAIAVIPVIFFHAGFEFFKGGFVGVDVFFVISGYLITSVILQEMEEKRFSLAGFYERRARRILPALFFVMLVSLLFSWMILMPPDMLDFSQSVLATTTFSSNILFWLESGYFGRAAELKPLLHTWSLAVEEQYYILFPLFLLLTWRFGKKAILIILGFVFLISLLGAHFAAYHRPEAGFYLLPTRGWEILVGAFAAFILHEKKEIEFPKVERQILSSLGLFMIAAAICLFDAQTPFPSLYALIPTVGAFLVVLFAKEGTLVYVLLSQRALVGIGLISYSAYLWHQPILVFARHRSLTELSDLTILFLCFLSFPLAYLSWRFIEQPFRRRERIKRQTLLLIIACASLVFIIFGGYGYMSNGIPSRFNKTVQAIFVSGPKVNYEHGVIGNEKNIKGAVIGDSHAISLIEILDEDLRAKNLGAEIMTKAGCPPITNIYRHDMNNFKDKCHIHNSEAYDKIIKDKNIEFVVIGARFALYLESDYFDNHEGGIENWGASRVLYDSIEFRDTIRSDEVRYAFLYNQFLTDFSRLLDAGKTLILLYPTPEAGWGVPDRLARLIHYDNFAGDIDTSYEVFQRRNKRAYEMLDSLGNSPNVIRIYPENIFCKEGRCIASIDQLPLYSDNNHLSNKGISMMGESIEQALSKLSISR
jgi:peptidoglycan/LPS O-acetylase OafA/YrhL